MGTSIMHLVDYYYVLVYAFRDTSEQCFHSKSSWDPHPLLCMEKAGISECIPEATCLYCSKLDADVWDKIFATRAKREARRKLAL